MAITNGYCTAAELKARLDIDDVNDDTIIEQVITAVSRWIDDYCWRFFYSASADETRYFTPHDNYILFPGDIVSITSLKTDDDGDRTYEVTWATSDYDLTPYNATLDGEPYTAIETTPLGDYTFSKVKKSVEITGIFGWSSVPAAVKEACLIQSARIFKRKDAPFGVAGTTQLGALQLVPNLDPDVKQILDRYKRRHT